MTANGHDGLPRVVLAPHVEAFRMSSVQATPASPRCTAIAMTHAQSRWRMQLHLHSPDFHDPLRWAGAFESTHTRRLFPRTHGGGCLEIQTPRCNSSLSSGPACYHPHRGAVVWTASGGRSRRIRCELLLSRNPPTQNTQKQKLGRGGPTASTVR